MSSKSLDSLNQKIKKFKNPPSLGFISCLIFLVFFNFYSALDNEFVSWDDQFYVTDNPLVSSPTFEHFKILWYKIISLNYHPLTMISLWLNSFFSGTVNAFSFIATNIFFHALNTILVFLFIKKLNGEKLWGAFTVALIFGIHPMHVESVVWVSERKDVLYGFFFLLASISYLQYLEKGKTRNYWWTLLLFILSCGAKAMAVAFVPILYLIDFFQKRNFKNQRLHFEKIPFILIGLLVGLIAINVQAGGDFYGFLESSDDAKALSQSDYFVWMEKIKYASYGLFFYLKKFLFPFQLSALHPYSSIYEWNFLSLMPLVGFGFLGLIVYCFFKHRKVAFGLTYFLLTIVLVLQFIPVGVAVVAERYTYLPYIGLGFLVSLLLQNTSKKISKNGVVLFLILLTGYLTTLTKTQVETWQNHVSLFSNVVDVYPNDAYAREYLSTGLWLDGDLDGAISEMEYAVEKLNYNNTYGFQQLGVYWDDKGDAEKAVAYFNKSIELDSLNYIAYYYRGLTILPTDPKSALSDFIFSTHSKNEVFQQLIYEPLARCYGMLGDNQNAIKYFTKTIQVNGNIAMNYFNRGITYERLGEVGKALEDYKKAVELDSEMEDAKVRIELLQQ